MLSKYKNLKAEIARIKKAIEEAELAKKGKDLNEKASYNNLINALKSQLPPLEEEAEKLYLVVRKEADAKKPEPVYEPVKISNKYLTVTRFPSIDGKGAPFISIEMESIKRCKETAKTFHLDAEMLRHVATHVLYGDADYVTKYVKLEVENWVYDNKPLLLEIINISWVQEPETLLTETSRRASFLQYLAERNLSINAMDDRTLNDLVIDWCFQNRVAIGYNKFSVDIAKGKVASGFIKAIRKDCDFDLRRLLGISTLSLKEACEIYPEIGKHELHRRLLASGYKDTWINHKRVLSTVCTVSSEQKCVEEDSKEVD